MGRSVSTPRTALHVVHASVSNDDEDNYRDDIDNLKYALIAAFPGYEKCEHWSNNEDFAFLRNGRFLIGRSEYCGLLAVWIVPEPTNDDHDVEIDRDEATVLRHSLEDADMGERLRKAVSAALGDVYAKTGTFSNGESVYHKVAE